MTKGFVLNIPTSRVNLFLDCIEEYGKFSEPVPQFSHSNTSPLIVFILSKDKIITHLAIGRAGMYAGTSLRRLNLEEVHSIENEIPISKLLKNVDLKVRRHIKRVFEGEGILPPQSFLAVVGAIRQDLEQFKAELFEELRKAGVRSHGKQQDQKEWLKSYEVRKLLGISPGTLQNLRVNGTLHYTKIGGLLYYRREEIQQLLENNLR